MVQTIGKSHAVLKIKTFTVIRIVFDRCAIVKWPKSSKKMRLPDKGR